MTTEEKIQSIQIKVDELEMLVRDSIDRMESGWHPLIEMSEIEDKIIELNLEVTKLQNQIESESYTD